MKPKRLLLAKPRGFCAGVDRAIDVVRTTLDLYPPPIYVRKEIVHNKHVVDDFAARGVVFVEEIDEVPEGAVLVFSAHGVSPQVRARAAAKRLRVIDATCPLVTKVHQEAVRFVEKGLSIILVGHKGHDEVVGTTGEAPEHIQVVGSVEEAENVTVPDPDRVAVTTQTTLGVDDANEIIAVLKRRFPKLATPSKDDICYATQNRQEAVKSIAQEADVILVLGSDNSSNSLRLKEVGEAAGARAYLIDDVSEINPAWLEGARSVGVTAGASAPEYLVEEAVNYFRAIGVSEVQEIQAAEEKVTFAPPAELVQVMTDRLTSKKAL